MCSDLIILTIIVIKQMYNQVCLYMDPIFQIYIIKYCTKHIPLYLQTISNI